MTIDKNKNVLEKDSKLKTMSDILIKHLINRKVYCIVSDIDQKIKRHKKFVHSADLVLARVNSKKHTEILLEGKVAIDTLLRRTKNRNMFSLTIFQMSHWIHTMFIGTTLMKKKRYIKFFCCVEYTLKDNSYF